jgi:hypothetical protein
MGAIGEEAIEEEASICGDGDGGGGISAEVAGVGVDMDDGVVLGDGVSSGGDFGEFDADGEDGIEVAEDGFGGGIGLGAVAPTDGEGVLVGECAFSGDGGCDGGLEHFGGGLECGRGLRAADTGVDADFAMGLGEDAACAEVGGFIPWGSEFERDVVVEIPGFEPAGVGDDDADGSGFAGASEAEGLKESGGDLSDVMDLVEVFDDGSEDGGVGETVDLGDGSVRSAGDIGEEDDDGAAIEEGFADSGEGVGEAWSGDEGADADFTGDAGGGIGHDGGGGFVGDEEVGESGGLHGVPEFVVLGAWDAEDAADALALEGGDGSLSAGHAALDAAVRVEGWRDEEVGSGW